MANNIKIEMDVEEFIKIHRVLFETFSIAPNKLKEDALLTIQDIYEKLKRNSPSAEKILNDLSKKYDGEFSKIKENRC